MAGKPQFVPAGVIPACLLPFFDDLSIDEASLRNHLRDIAGVSGVTAITVNGHASEVSSCTFEEQQRVLAVAIDEIGQRLPIVNGVYAEGSLEAARIARMAQDGGASALLVFPPGPFTLGQRPEMALAHFRRIADASDLPLIIFQYPLHTGQGYPMATLKLLIDEIPTVVAMKDWTPQVPLHERHVVELSNYGRGISVLSTNSAWLMSSLVLGCPGLISGAGSVIAQLQVDLLEALRKDDLAAARAHHQKIRMYTDIFYSDPFVDMHNRMKEMLFQMGKLPRAVVRPPLARLPQAEIDRIRSVVEQAGLMPQRNAA